MKSKLSRCSRAIDEHLMARHADAFQWNARLATTDRGDQGGGVRRPEGKHIRQSDAWRGTANQWRKNIENILERHVPAPENVPLPDLSAFCSEQVSLSDVFNGDDVETRVHVCRHPAIQKIHD